MPASPQNFNGFREATKIEMNAAFERYDEEARMPVHQKLRLGNVAGPLVCKTAENYKATFKDPDASFRWGKVRVDKKVHPFNATTIPVRAANLPDGKLSPESIPNKWETRYRKKPITPLPIQPGDKCLFVETVYDGYFNTIKVLGSFPKSETWPSVKASTAKLPVTAADTNKPSDERALTACLEESLPILLIKGPPGTGKTDLLALAAIELASIGKKVGIVSVSHEVVNNALKRIVKLAREGGKPLPSILKHGGNEDLDGIESERIDAVSEFPDIWGAVMASAINFYKIDPKDKKLILPEFAYGECDVLMFDEAGQIPAYDAASLSKLANRLIFFGDEDQLPNIAHGSHAPGSHGDSSAMRYLRATLPKELRIALETSHRMNTAICGLIQQHFYSDIALKPGKNAEAHLLENGKPFPALVLDRFPHKTPSMSSSSEEATRVAEWAQRLLRMQVVLESKASRKMIANDIAILTPFRAHASAIKRALRKAGIPNAEEIRTGTVDSLQGQGAAVVIYSLATSSPDYIANQAEWLFSSNRWNVAISRAMACAIVVGDVDAHFQSTPKALNGIALQQRISPLLEVCASTNQASRVIA